MKYRVWKKTEVYHDKITAEKAETKLPKGPNVFLPGLNRTRKRQPKETVFHITKNAAPKNRIPYNKGYGSQEPDFIETAESRFL